jgi:hypothetical protein
MRTRDDGAWSWTTGGLSRRSFLELTAALLAASGVGCASDPDEPAGPRPTDTDPPTPGEDPTAGLRAAWEELLEAVRQSPDHLVAAADRAVQARDLDAIVAVARDAVRTVAAGSSDFGHQQLLWGPAGALRSATGSLGDKAELLRGLLVAAGFEARVREGRAADDPAWVAEQVLASPAPVFAPALSAERREALSGLLPTAGRSFEVDADGRAAAALVDAWEAGLVGVAPPAAFPQGAPLLVPVVEVLVDGEWLPIDVATRGLPPGETRTQGSRTEPGPLRATPDVTLTLLAVDNTRPDHRDPLATLVRPSEQLIGRSLWIGATPAAPFQSVLGLPLALFSRFVPYLALRTPGTPADPAALAAGDPDVAVGRGIDVSGEVIDFDPVAGTATLGSTTVAGTSAPGAVDRVASLTLTVGATRFPLLELVAQALDADGAPVAGLGSDAWRVTEDGAELPVVFLEHAPPAPRVLFVLDRSLSIPAEIRDNAGAMLAGIADEVLRASPDATFRLLAVGGDPDDGTWTSDPDALVDAVATQFGGSSELWRAMDQAIDLLPTLLVLMSDGVTMDLPTDAVRAKLGRCPPSLYVGLGAGEHALLRELAEFTAGTYLAADGVAEVEAATVEAVAARQVPRTVCRALAPEAGPATRTVTVSLRPRPAVTVAGDYTVPPAPERAPRPRLQGLALRVQVGTSEPIERVVFGVVDRPASEADFEDMHAALFGAAEVRFEGGAPTLAVQLDERIRSRIGLLPVLRPLASGDAQAALEAALQGVPAAFPTSTTLHQALALPASGVTPSGIRAVMTTGYRRFDGEAVSRSDIFPLGPLRSVAGDAAAARRETLLASARLALLEKESFTDDTIRRLDGRPLALLDPFESITAVRSDLDAAGIAAWRQAFRGYEAGRRLVPTTGPADAFWYFDPRTQAALGVLADGSGGGVGGGSGGCGVEGVLDGAEALATLLGLLGVLGGPAGGWVGFSIAIQRKALAATILLEALLPVDSTVDPAAGGGDSTVPDPGEDIADALSDALRDAAAGELGLLGEVIEDFGTVQDFADLGAGLQDLADGCL